MKQLLLLGVVTAMLAACAAPNNAQYHHGKYEAAVYGYFKSDSLTIEDQISLLQQTISEAQINNKPIPPGLHAHLGMLYFETGNAVLGKEHFEIEKTLFPESTHFIDFLLKSSTGA